MRGMKARRRRREAESEINLENAFCVFRSSEESDEEENVLN